MNDKRKEEQAQNIEDLNNDFALMGLKHLSKLTLSDFCVALICFSIRALIENTEDKEAALVLVRDTFIESASKAIDDVIRKSANSPLSEGQKKKE